MPRSPAGTPPPATPTPPHTPLRSDGPLRTVTGLLDSKEKVYMQSLDSEYHSHVQWLRCMILLAKKRVIEDTNAEHQPTRQSPKKPRRSVMEAAAVAQVKNKVKFWNQLATSSPASSTQTPSKPPRPLVSTAVALPHIPTTTPASAAPSAPIAVAPPICSPPPLSVPEPPTSDYTAVFGRLNLNDTLVGGGLGTIKELNDSATCKEGAEAGLCPTAEALASELQQLRVLEVEMQVTEQEDEEVAGAVGMDMDLVVVVEGEGKGEGSGGRESVEEVLCDFRSGYVKPWTPLSMQVNVKPFSSIISAATSTSSAATPPLQTTTPPPPPPTTAPCTSSIPLVPPPKPLKPPSPPAAEPEGPEPIIEYNQKRPVVSPPTAVGDVISSASAPSALSSVTGPLEPLASATGAAQFFKKIASAFHLGPSDATKTPYPPIEGFDTVQESYAMSDSDSAEERNEYSDDEDDEDDLGGRAPQKKIPAWARGQVLAAALERQFNVCAGGSWVDPDTIFPEVTTCNLEEIFKVRKKRYYKRTSSGNWGQDAIKPCEKLAYKRQLGFDKSTH